MDGSNEYFALNLISTGGAYPTEIVITYGNAAEECEHVAGEWETEKAATCVEDGRRVQRCSVCNEVLHSETIAATGHAYGEWTMRTEPTETTDGLKERRCQHCDDVQTEVVPATGSDKPDPIDPNPDKPGDDKPDTDKPGDDKNSGGMTISCNSVITSSAAILLAAAVVPVAIAVKRKRD